MADSIILVINILQNKVSKELDYIIA